MSAELPTDATTFTCVATAADAGIRVDRFLAEAIDGLSRSRVKALIEEHRLHRDTILKILVVAGENCEKLMGRLIVNVPVKDVQCDEVWTYVQQKEGHKRPAEAHDTDKGGA